MAETVKQRERRLRFEALRNYKKATTMDGRRKWWDLYVAYGGNPRALRG